MRSKVWAVATVLSMGLSGCTATPAAPPGGAANTVREFSFPGGQFKDGRISLDRDVKVEKVPGTRKVALRRATGPGLEFDCSCILEAGGFCFPVVQDDGPGPITLMCGSSGCGTGDAPFCLEEISEPAGGFRFQALVVATPGTYVQ